MAAKHDRGEDTSSSDEEEGGKEIPKLDADSIEHQQGIHLLQSNGNNSSGLENSSQDDDSYPPPGWTISGRRIQQCTDDNSIGIRDDGLYEDQGCRASQENDDMDQLTDNINIFIFLFIILIYLRAF
ncbi:uncharacterized protein LOC111322960 [Stylophora pistillata]|uniref:uncharacterized protein LOC111322960 n=1 Tax=Stylophora pistillata TaxID=50429 RepID=UPI000C04E52A|nr:uncharacterized protein LOC111322960 [Stylophora pistillata]XP_022781935.1 uncharacterized protein LOC111322960 [Stylophora pistillata]